MNRLRRARNSLAGRLPAGPLLVALGLTWLAIAVWNFQRELTALADPQFPVAAFVLTGGLSLCIVYLGYRLSTGPFDARERWAILGWTAAGVLVTTLLHTATLAIRAAEGRLAGEPQFPLLVVGAVGALAGYGIGELLADLRRTAAEAKEARDGMAFANSLLRHDVANALQVLLGQADVLSTSDDERAQQAGTRIESQVEALYELTNSADAVSRVLTGESLPTPRDITQDIESAVETITDSFPSATVETDLHDQLTVSGTDALKPAIGNILDNAVEHTHSSPKVRVTTEQIDEHAVVRIEDDGPGIPESQRSAVFERGVTTGGGSNGLGLHIVSTLIERSGGSIRAEDSDLGGAAFVVELPLAEE